MNRNGTLKLTLVYVCVNLPVGCLCDQWRHRNAGVIREQHASRAARRIAHQQCARYGTIRLWTSGPSAELQRQKVIRPIIIHLLRQEGSTQYIHNAIQYNTVAYT